MGGRLFGPDDALADQRRGFRRRIGLQRRESRQRRPGFRRLAERRGTCAIADRAGQPSPFRHGRFGRHFAQNQEKDVRVVEVA